MNFIDQFTQLGYQLCYVVQSLIHPIFDIRLFSFLHKKQISGATAPRDFYLMNSYIKAEIEKAHKSTFVGCVTFLSTRCYTKLGKSIPEKIREVIRILD